jgi:hypothetical protein
MANNAKVGGILSIVAGGLGLLGMLMVVALAIFFAVMPGLFAEDFNAEFNGGGMTPETMFIILAVIYGVMGLVGALIGALAIVGGVFALKKKYWGWALAGAIGGNLICPLCGIPALIFISMGKPEFDGGAATAPPAHPALVEKIVG